MYIIIIFFILIVLIMSIILNHILSKDNDYIYPSSKKLIILLTLQVFINILVACTHYENLYKIIYIALSIPLFSIAYTDLVQKQIYLLSNYILMFICLITIIIACINNNIQNNINLFVMILLYSSFVLIEYHLKLFGKGDARTLLSLQFILETLRSDTVTVVLQFELLLWHILISILIFIIRNIKHIEIRKLKLKTSKPFAPDIIIAFYLILIFLGLQ